MYSTYNVKQRCDRLSTVASKKQ